MPSDDLVMGRGELERVREWALQRLAAGSEPPWSWYQLMKLREAIDALLEGMAVTQPMAGSQESPLRSGTCLRLVDEVDPQDTALHRRFPHKIPLPT